MDLIKKSRFTFGTRILLLLLGVGSNVILVRSLGAEGKGIYTLIGVLGNVLLILGSMGLSEANIYFVGKRECSLRELASNSLFSALLFGIILIGVVGAFIRPIHGFLFKDCDITLLYFAVASLPFLMISSYFNFIMLGMNRIKEFNILQVIRPMIIMVGLLIALIMFKKGIMAAIIIWLGGVIVGSMFSLAFIRRQTPIGLRVLPSLFKKTIKFGFKAYIANLNTFLSYRLDIFMISFFKDVKEVGYYSISVLLAELVWYIADSFARVLAPEVATFKESKEKTPQVARQVIFLTTSAMLLLAMLGGYIIVPIFGSSFSYSIKPLRWLSVGIISVALSKILSADLLGRGKIEVAMRASFIGIVVNFCANLVLIPRFSIQGAAIASSISYTITALFILLQYQRISKFGIRELIFIKKGDIRELVNIRG